LVKTMMDADFLCKSNILKKWLLRQSQNVKELFLFH
jgi:hypothetical protein